MSPRRHSLAWSDRLVQLALLILLGSLAGCLHLQQPLDSPGPRLYLPEKGTDLSRRRAPAFLVHNPQQAYNRIGRPFAGLDDLGGEIVAINTHHPSMYWQYLLSNNFAWAYSNIVYRVHFPATPPSLVPFFIGAGQNLGLLVIVTLDAQERPVLITTVGTCGCYVSLTATDHLPPAALPVGWSDQPQQIYGETLPARLDFAGKRDPRLLVVVRPGEHRVMDLRVVESAELDHYPDRQAIELLPNAALRHLALPGGGETSFFYPPGWPLGGHVKGAWKPWETLLMSWFSLDGLVGMDKDYPDPDNPFYTSLKPWARADSDLRDFPRFLRYWGWRL